MSSINYFRITMATGDDLRNLAKRLIESPASINEFTNEQTASVHRHLNPLGTVITEKKKYANMSIINHRDKYQRNLIATTFMGYLYTTADEYTPEEEVAKLTADYNAAVALIKESVDDETKCNKLIASAKASYDERVKTMTTTARGIVKRFLNRNLEFNPTHHVRKATSDGSAVDPERKEPTAEIARLCKNKAAADKIESKLAASPEKMYKYMRSMLLATQSHLTESMAALETCITIGATSKAIRDQDAHGILMKKLGVFRGINADLSTLAKPLAEKDSLAMWTRAPPIDFYHQFNRYYVNHYEQCVAVCNAMYGEKADVEFAVIFYDCFDDEESARQYKIAHESEFRADVFTIENSGVTLLGPYKENRGRVDFYNKNTEVLKLMMSQMESDHKLGKDLMDKQVKKKKGANVREAGPDAPGLAEYSRAVNTVQDLGAKKMLSAEEQEELAKAVVVKEDAEVPDDAIQMDVFYPQTNAEGETMLAKTKMYTQAEAPLHMEDNSPYMENYQPKRDKSLVDAYRTKIITVDGKKQTIHEPVAASAASK